MQNGLVRVGLLGNIGRFRLAAPLRPARGQRVVLRTARGLEIGEFLTLEEDFTTSSRSEVTLVENAPRQADGELLRTMTPEDELLSARLERRRHEAFEVCQTWLKDRGVDAQLVDVETLFDGGAIYFYFLGDAPPAAVGLEQELGEQYAAKIQLADFANLLEEGCGPGCGTEAGAGCASGASTGGCTSCGLATACGTKA